jgi:hypothetical protein
MEYEKVQINPIPANFKIDFESSLIIELDGETGIDHPIRGYTQENEFYLYNGKNKTIYVYELEVGKINQVKKRIPVPLDASNNFRDVSELYFHNKDSIFIYDRSNEMSDREDLFLLNGQGEIINKYSIFNSTQGDPIKLHRIYTYNGQTMYFQNGRIFMALGITVNTNEDLKKPLLVYNLLTGEKEFYGNYPVLPDYAIYGQYTLSFSFAFDSIHRILYFSWPFEEILYSLDVNTLGWHPLIINTNTFVPPVKAGPQEDIIPYLDQNEWFIGLYYDYASSSLFRLKRMRNLGKPEPEIKARFDVEGLIITPADQKMNAYRINPKSLETELIPALNMYRIYLFHPTLGPMINAQSHPDFPDLDVEDYLILSPIQIISSHSN